MHPVDMGHRSLGKSGTMDVVCCLGAGSEAHDRYVGARLAGMQPATGTERETARHLCREGGLRSARPRRRVWPIHTFREHGPLAGVQLDVDLWAGWISDFSSDLNVEKSERNDPQF